MDEAAPNASTSADPVDSDLPPEGGADAFNNDAGGAQGGDEQDGGGMWGSAAGTDSTGSEIGFSSTPSFLESIAGQMTAFLGGTANMNYGASIWPHRKVFDPIDLSRADKLHVQVDYRSNGAASVQMARVYHSNALIGTARVTVPMGAGWHMFYDRSLQVLSGSQVRLHRANGQTVDFSGSGSVWSSSLPAGVLMPISGGWQYVNHRNTVERYDANGKLLSISDGGLVSTLQYDGNNRLANVINPFGRSLGFAYDGAGRVAVVTLPGGINKLQYGYDPRGNLSSIQFADGTTRSYAYENSSFPNAMTGLVDESGRRRLTWSYDGAGRPNGGHYGTATGNVSASYNSDGSQVTTTDSRGTQRTRTFATMGIQRVLTSAQTAATPDSAATSLSFGYDGNGNPASMVSRSGEVQQIGTDARGRTTSATRAYGTPQAVPSQTTWHPTFRLPTQLVSRGVTHDFTVDGVGRITAITRSSAGTTQTMLSRSYDAQNLLHSITDARGSTTTYLYDSAGNRSSITDSLGHTTSFKSYDANGQAGEIDLPDGSVVTRTFDTRGRLRTRTHAGSTTTYDHDNAGRVIKLTHGDGSWQAYSYDAAGLLQGVTNDRSESTSIVRDVAGIVTARKTYNAGSALTFSASRQINAVGHVSAWLDANAKTTKLLYGADGRASGVTDPLNITRNLSLDVLSRPATVTVPNTTAMRNAGGAANVQIQHTYDSLANHRSSVDTAAVPTTYGYNVFNQRTSEASNDAGASSVSANAAGDVTAATPATGVALTPSYDTLGRLTGVTAGSSTITYAYVSNQAGPLIAQMTDPSGNTAWTYDTAGRVLTKTQTIGSTSRTISIVRDGMGRPTSMTYPSGMRVDVTYSADVVSSLSINGATLFNNIGYLPFSQTATRWSWGNGAAYTRSFDANGRVAAVSLGTVQRSYAYDAAGRVWTQTDQGPQGTKQSSYTYDEAGHISGYADPSGATQGFAWDVLGNRVTDVVGGSTRSYSYASGTNRLSTVTNLRSYQYNANGSVSSDGTGFTFAYDNFGRVGSIGSSSRRAVFSSNGLGQRVVKTVSTYSSGGGGVPTAAPGANTVMASPSPNATGTWTTKQALQFIYDDAGHLVGEYDSVSGGTSQETVWFNGQPVATVVAGVIYYIYADNLGTPRSIVRANGNLEVWRWDSDPFGTSAVTYPALSQGASIYYNLRFPGQYLDNETGLHYNFLRYYDPRTGRYIQTDPGGLAGGLSRYTYVYGKPLNYADPYGLSGVAFTFGGDLTIFRGGSAGSGGYFSFDTRQSGTLTYTADSYGLSSGLNSSLTFFAGSGTELLSGIATTYSISVLDLTFGVTFSSDPKVGVFGITAISIGAAAGLPVGADVITSNTTLQSGGSYGKSSAPIAPCH